MKLRHLKVYSMVMMFLILLPCSVLSQNLSQSEIIRDKVELIGSTGFLQIGDAAIASVTVLPRLYERNGFQPIWQNPDSVEQLLKAVNEMTNEGLNPHDYHLTEIQSLREEIASGSPDDKDRGADLDILLTDSLIRLGYHLLFGKEDPVTHHPHWNLDREIDDIDPDRFIQTVLDADSLAEAIESLKPNHPAYGRLKAALAKYRAIQANGGWQSIPDGPALREGMRDERVTLLRRRLTITDDLTQASDDPMLFDERLNQAIIHFQKRHRLTPDGVVGKNTLAALNVPVDQKIDQLRVNLERARWVLHGIDKEPAIIVDIAGFHVFYYRNNEIVWNSKAQVGKPYRNTPAFKSRIKYLVFNPTWTIPPGILHRDILPAVKRNPDYLKTRNIRILDRDGEPVDPGKIEWSRYSSSRRNFPYMLRQDPGPDNALGQIKFIFPNKHFVYLHDTPSRSLFDRPERAFSSGCIRVEKPIELAELLLKDPHQWSRESIMNSIESRQTRTVFLPEEVPVLLLYWTVLIDNDGVVNFKEDIYKRDRAVLEGLDGEYRLSSHPPAG